MKRKAFIKHLESKGCYLLRHGGRHDIYFNSNTSRKQPVPRHPDINDHLAKHIKKHLEPVWLKNDHAAETPFFVLRRCQSLM